MKKPYTVFITGASEGIGASIAKTLCSNGLNVFAFARREAKLNEIKESCSNLSGKFEFFVGNVTSNDDLQKANSMCLNRFGNLDILIPNAGIGFFNPLDQGSLKEWESMVDVNVTGVLRTIHSALPQLLKSKGHIINIGSVAARNVFPNSGVYCATKHAVLAISESLKIEFLDRLAITTINPGAVNTTFIDKTNNEELKREYKPNFDSGMDPDFIAKAVFQAIEANGSGIYSEITLRPDRRI
jgi:NADP-dependent 3-hydroxy acid dehydrogenase YdfG